MSYKQIPLTMYAVKCPIASIKVAVSVNQMYSILLNMSLRMSARARNEITAIRLVAPCPESLAYCLGFFAGYQHTHYLSLLSVHPVVALGEVPEQLVPELLDALLGMVRSIEVNRKRRAAND